MKILLKNGRKVKVPETQGRALLKMGMGSLVVAEKPEPKPVPAIEAPIQATTVPAKRVYRRRSVTPAVTAVVVAEPEASE